MKQVARFINRAIDARADEAALAKIHAEVKEFTGAFPLYRSRIKG
jgi:glycine/serine hydroxymethyltransferase